MPSTITDKQFEKVYNNYEEFPTLNDVAKELGLTREGVRSRAKAIKSRYNKKKKGSVKLVDRAALTRNTPIILPEMQYEHVDKTREELIKKLQDLYRLHPEKEITRIKFREFSGWSDSSWNHQFGTFLEFKRAAGIAMNRHQHGLERDIAKHNSVDHYRELNDRHDFESRYNRKPNNTRHRIIVGGSDFHDIEVDPFFLRVFIEACRMVQPDYINLGGDIFDLPEFGRFPVDPREWDVVGRIKFVHDNILAPLREACPNTQIDFVEGNHEFRLLRHLADASPALKAVLSDLHGWTVPKLLGLDDYEVNYIAKADLAAFTKGDQKKEVERSYKIYDDAVLIHHHPHARDWGMPGWNGHHHSWRVFHQKSAKLGAYQWLQLGCGHRQNASYCEGEYWSMGFNICHYNPQTLSVNHEYVNVTDMAVVGGHIFQREADEMIGVYADR